MLNSGRHKTDFACFSPATGLDMAIADTMQACKPMTVKTSKYAVDSYKPEFGISDSRFSCYFGFPTDAYYIYPPNNMDGKMQNCKVQIKFTL